MPLAVTAVITSSDFYVTKEWILAVKDGTLAYIIDPRTERGDWNKNEASLCVSGCLMDLFVWRLS